MKKSEPFDEAMLLHAKERHVSAIRSTNNTSGTQMAQGHASLSKEPKDAPRVKPIPQKSLIKQDKPSSYESAEQGNAKPSYDDNNEEIRESGSKPHSTQTSLDKRSDSIKQEERGSAEDASVRSNEKITEPKTDEKAAKTLEKSISITSKTPNISKSLSQRSHQTGSSVDSNALEDSQRVESHKKKDASISSEEKSKLEGNTSGQVRKASKTLDSGSSADSKTLGHVQSKSQLPPIPKPRTSPTQKIISLETTSDQNEGVKEPGKEKNKEIIKGKSAKKSDEGAVKTPQLTKTKPQKEEKSEESSEAEESYEDKNHSEEEKDDDHTEEEEEDGSLNESDEEDDESVEEDASVEEDDVDEENDTHDDHDVEDNSDNDVEDQEDTRSHSTEESNEEEEQDLKHDSEKGEKSKGSVSHVAEVHQGQVQDSSANETSQDSEGVVIIKSPSSTRKSSLTNKDKISITIAEFKATKGAKFLKNKNIEKLYVEYKFLDLPPEELETPSFPKPKVGGESFNLNFTKIIPVDRAVHSKRRRKLVKMLTSEPSGDQAKDASVESSLLIFTLVSEPPEDKEDQDCEDVGAAKIDLKTILSTGQDIVNMAVDVFSSEVQSRVSRLLNTGNKPIATLTISIEASEVFKSLRIK